nr:MAG TPA: hypothetical protein [Caudoviricetes sp.]
MSYNFKVAVAPLLSKNLRITLLMPLLSSGYASSPKDRVEISPSL